MVLTVIRRRHHPLFQPVEFGLERLCLFPFLENSNRRRLIFRRLWFLVTVSACAGFMSSRHRSALFGEEDDASWVYGTFEHRPFPRGIDRKPNHGDSGFRSLLRDAGRSRRRSSLFRDEIVLAPSGVFSAARTRTPYHKAPFGGKIRTRTAKKISRIGTRAAAIRSPTLSPPVVVVHLSMRDAFEASDPLPRDLSIDSANRFRPRLTRTKPCTRRRIARAV